MSQPAPLTSAAAAARRFLAGLRACPPQRIEAKVASLDGMPLLCAVEEVFGAAAPAQAARELVWLSGGPQRPGAHVLHLQAFGAAGEVLAQARFEFEG